MAEAEKKYNGFIRFYFLMYNNWEKIGEDKTEALVYIDFLFFKEPDREYSEYACITEEGDYLVQIPVVLPEGLKDRSWRKNPEFQGVLEEKAKELFPHAMEKYKTFLKAAMKRAETLEKLGPLGTKVHRGERIRMTTI